MKQRKPNTYLTPLVFLLSLMLVVGCYEPSEGCVEFWAVNYNVLADELCEDCCTAPEVRVKLEFQLPDSTNYGFGDTLLLSNGTYVTLHNANFILSHFELYNNGAQVATVNDSIELDGIMYEQDFGFSKKQGQNITLTEYQEPFAIDSISFSQGLIPAWRDTSIFGLDNSIIAEAIDSLYQEDTDDFTLFSCTISLDTIDQDTLQYISSLRDTTILYDNEVMDSITLKLGEHTNLILKVDLVPWLEMVTIDPANTQAVANQLIDVLPDFMTLELSD